MKRVNGFTLIEILAVIAIIMVLLGLLVPTIGNAMHKSNIAATKSILAKIEIAVKNYEAAFGEFPPDLSYKWLGKKLFSPTFGTVAPVLMYEEKWRYDKSADLDDMEYKDSWGSTYMIYWKGLEEADSTLSSNGKPSYTNLETAFQDCYGNRDLIIDTTTPGEANEKLLHTVIIWSKGPNTASGDTGTMDNIGNWGHSRGKML